MSLKHCVFCGGQHKFSPYNVTINKHEISNKVPVMNGLFMIDIVINNSYNHYIDIKKDFTISDALYWSDGIDIFDLLIRLCSNNIIKINNNCISGLLKLINCTVWWDIFMEHVILNDKYISNIQDHIKLCKILFDTVLDAFKEYSFLKYSGAIRIINDRSKRENERLCCELVIKKKEEKQNNITRQMEEIKKREQEEMSKEIKIININFEEQFLTELKNNKKYANKFLSTINVDQTIIATLAAEIGEISKLQSGINIIEKEKKVELWKYYLKQEADKKNGIKYKKQKYKANNIEHNTGLIIPEQGIELVLTSVQRLQYEKIYNDFLKPKTQNAIFMLDDWQKLAIEKICDGKSCLIMGPTAGGKTYVMMKGLDNIISNKNETVIYVAPTFHLAYQTYANIKATFPLRKVMLVTTEITNTITDATIYIGTAPELLNYFEIVKKKYSIGIFDEIHVASRSFCNKNDPYYKTDLLRTKSYCDLLKKCDGQIIAASATINGEDNLIKFIVDQINYDRKNKVTINDICKIKYENRIIPINEYRYVNDTIFEEIKRDSSGKEISISKEIINKNDISAKNLFDLLIQMKNKNMLPSIVFDITDDIAWSTYSDLIKYIDDCEKEDYSDYEHMITSVNKYINEFNTELSTKIMNENRKIDMKRLQSTSDTNNKFDSNLRSIMTKRIKTIEIIIQEAETILMKSIKAYNDSNKKSICEISGLSNEFGSFVKKNRITQAHIDMIKLIKYLKNTNRDNTDQLCQLPTDKGSYYRFSDSSCGMDQLKAIREPGSDESKWKFKKIMIALAEAQHIKPDDINGIIDIIMKGLEYGIAIINPSLPFVIQNIILQNLRTKNLGVLLASENMSMGINYPLRSVVIKNNNTSVIKNNKSEINPIKLIQMAGRCGRRGKDSEAHVIYWGISNAAAAHYSYIPPINYPGDFMFNDMKNIDYDQIAIKLGNVFKTLYFEENKEVKKKNLIIDDDFDVIEKKKCEERKVKVILKNSQYLHPIIQDIAVLCNFTTEESIDLADMICNISNNIILDKYFEQSFSKSRSINLIIHTLINIYNKYATSTYIDFLKYIEHVVHILQSCEYRLIKLIEH